MSGDKHLPVRSPEGAQPPRSKPAQQHHGYFDLGRKRRVLSNGHAHAHSRAAPDASPASDDTLANGTPASVESPDHRSREKDGHNDHDESVASEILTVSTPDSVPLTRETSMSSVTFRAPRITLPQGTKKPHGGRRIRDASPPHRR